MPPLQEFDPRNFPDLPPPDLPPSLNELCQAAHHNAIMKGFYDNVVTNNSEILAKLMLVVSECAEACEDVRSGNMELKIDEQGKPVGLPSELADIAIRLFDLCGWLDIDLSAAIATKMKYNATRGYKHGKTI